MNNVDNPNTTKKPISYLINLDIPLKYLKYTNIVITAVIILAILRKRFIASKPKKSKPAGFKKVNNANMTRMYSLSLILR